VCRSACLLSPLSLGGHSAERRAVALSHRPLEEGEEEGEEEEEGFDDDDDDDDDDEEP